MLVGKRVLTFPIVPLGAGPPKLDLRVWGSGYLDKVVIPQKMEGSESKADCIWVQGL